MDRDVQQLVPLVCNRVQFDLISDRGAVCLDVSESFERPYLRESARPRFLTSCPRPPS